MFGSKIRNWMENHIVRPKKNKNKNKNGNCSSNSVSANTPNSHKGNSYQCDPTLVSPARRSEVSPIPSDKTSRVGWQSPQENYLSPKSDFYSYRHQIKSNTTSLTKSNKHKNSFNSEIISSSSPSHHYQLNQQMDPKIQRNFHSKTMNANYKNFDYTKNLCENGNSYNFCSNESLNKIKMNDIENMNTIMTTGTVTSISSTSSSTTSNTFSKNCEQIFSPNTRMKYQKRSSKADIENIPSKHYSNTLNNKTTQNTKNPLDGYDLSEIRFINKPQMVSSLSSSSSSKEESKYGKILTTGRYANDTYQKNCIKDKVNTNSIRGNSNNNNNNTQIDKSGHYYYQYPDKQNQNHHNQHIHHHHYHNKPDDSSVAVIHRTNINDKNLLRANRYTNQNGSVNHNHHPGHIMNSLSSPESAYSTGYSTDGTSPGASYTPEYYINMRTGTHYFPKNVSYGIAEVTNRLKFGLNKIDETHQESNFRNNLVQYHKRTESFDLGKNVKIIQENGCNRTLSPTPNLSPYLTKTTPFQNLKAIESPSPRQRCRIRTNPWILTSASSTSSLSNYQRKTDFDSASTSSGVRSNSDTGTNDKRKNNKISSDSDSSTTTTEDFSTKTFSPNTIRRRQITIEASKIDKKLNQKSQITITTTNCTAISSITHNNKLKSENSQQDSDEDTTLQEMMGKYDESYIYEKETDILSDSDQTNCLSDIDTGQDAEDECETDDLLEIDYIDTSSIQEISEKDKFRNTGNCTYYNHNGQQIAEKRNLRSRRSRKLDQDGSKRRKKLLRKKKNSESVDIENKHKTTTANVRECRSVGGTPICLRRNQKEEIHQSNNIPLLTNRSNSLTFTQVHSVRSKVLAIAESEKALIKADLEADVKYKQLIHEAETILVSLKSNIRETPVASPRRACNLPANKRVEMLRNCEIDLKREIIKTNQSPPNVPYPAKLLENQEKSENIICNKRVEMLRYETSSAPNSPKSCRFSPRKTHLTNFINQNVLSPTEILRRKSFQEPNQLGTTKITSSTSSVTPKIFLNNEKQINSNPIKINFKKFQQNPNTKELYIESSDSDNDLNKKIIAEENVDVIIENKNPFLNDIKNETKSKENTVKPPLMSFRSLDIRNPFHENSYCPQSEPLKRKIYTGISNIDKIPKDIDLESEIPKQALLIKIEQLRNQRRANKARLENLNSSQKHFDENQIDNDLTDSSDINSNNNNNYNNNNNNNDSNNDNHTLVNIDENDDDSNGNNEINSDKRQLILDTLKDLKQSLEDQSVELCGLNDTEE